MTFNQIQLTSKKYLEIFETQHYIMFSHLVSYPGTSRQMEIIILFKSRLVTFVCYIALQIDENKTEKIREQHIARI